MSRRLYILAAGLLAVAGCKDDELDPLSKEAIDDVADDQGSGEGTDWTGTYQTEFELIDCDCPALELEENGMPVSFEICDAVDFSPEDGETPAEVVQTNGQMTMTLDDVGQMSGPVDADGSFTVASRINLDSLLFDNEFLGRIDGEFSKTDGTRGFEAVYAQRLVASLPGQEVDCRATFDLVGVADD